MPTQLPPPLGLKPRRSFFVTLLAWLMMIGGCIGMPISFITALMLLADSYGTANAGLFDSFLVVCGPFCLTLVGFGLLLRWRIAWAMTIALFLAASSVCAVNLAKGPTPTTTHTTPSGVKVTVIGSSPDAISLPIILLLLAFTAKLLTRGVRAEFFPATSAPSPGGRNWSVGHTGRDRMYYEEYSGHAVRRIEIDGEMLSGPTHHVLYFPSVAAWQEFPDWARDRRDEIIGRIKSEFREPDYAYQEGGSAGSSAASNAMTPAELRSHFRNDHTATPKQFAALLLCIVLTLAIAAWMVWLVTKDIQRGETTMPSKRPSVRRPISRNEEPAFYWSVIGLYGLLGTGCGGLALWGVGSLCRLKRKP